QWADGAVADGDAEQVRTQGFGLILAQPVSAGDHGERGLQARPLVARGHPSRQRGAGRGTAPRQNQAVELGFGDARLDRGQFDPRMAERLRVRTREGLPTVTARRGRAADGFIRRQQGAAREFVAGLPAPLAARGFPRRGRLTEGASLEGGREEFWEFWP